MTELLRHYRSYHITQSLLSSVPILCTTDPQAATTQLHVNPPRTPETSPYLYRPISRACAHRQSTSSYIHTSPAARHSLSPPISPLLWLYEPPTLHNTSVHTNLRCERKRQLWTRITSHPSDRYVRPNL